METETTPASAPPSPRVLTTLLLDGKEVAKKPIRAKTLTEVEAECRNICPTIQLHMLERILVFDTEFEDFIDMMDDMQYAVTERERMVLHFSSAPPVDPPLPPDVTTPSPQSTLKFVGGMIQMSREAPRGSEESDDSLLTDADIEKSAKIFGRDNTKPLTKYQEKINSTAVELAKENPALLLDRGTLLVEARKVLHDSGYEYARGKRSRSKAFGLPKKERVYTTESVREERMEELAAQISSLQTQLDFVKKGRTRAVSSNMYDLAVSFEQQSTELRWKLRKLQAEKVEIETRNTDLKKRKKKREKVGRKTLSPSKMAESEAQSEDSKLVTLEQILEARKFVKESSFCVRTPLLPRVQQRYHKDNSLELFLKLENTQVTGSFKVNGLSNQFAHLPREVLDGEKELITMSAGNYGKAMCYAAQERGLKAKVITPDTAPPERIKIMEAYGATVEQQPISMLQSRVDYYVKEHGLHYLHPFDDLDIIAGHASVGLDILEDLPNPDVIAVCCGGGGLVSGIASAVKLSGLEDTRIYCVEPETANVMYLSFKEGRAVSKPDSHSVASGLSPPFAGENTYNHCKHFTKDVLLVTDDEIVAAVQFLYERGLVVEPAGAAAFAALMTDKIPDVEGKKVVIVLTGSNVSPQQMYSLSEDN